MVDPEVIYTDHISRHTLSSRYILTDSIVAVGSFRHFLTLEWDQKHD